MFDDELFKKYFEDENASAAARRMASRSYRAKRPGSPLYTDNTKVTIGNYSCMTMMLGTHPTYWKQVVKATRSKLDAI